MNREPTLYDILGVPRSATQAQVRAAYLLLMKEHHPDVRAKLGGAGAGMAPLINRCYATLGDARKRAAYDALLDRETRTLPGRQLAATAARAGAVRRPSYAPTLLTAACLFCAAIVLAWIAAPHGAASPLAAFDWVAAAPVETPPDDVAPFPTESEIRHQALIAISMTADEAVGFSRSCYTDARQRGLSSAAALCVAFDEAFLYWRKGPGLMDGLPPYFSDNLVNFREAEALAPYGAAGERQLDQIREGAFAALLDQVNSAPDVGAIDLSPE